jgi:hypothetical protein
MDERNTAALTRRRLGGAVLLLAGIAVAAVVLWPGGEAKPAKKRTLPARIVSVPPLGLGFAHPTSWRRKVSKQVIGLRSPEGSIVVFFSSPVARPAVDEVLAGAKQELLKQFKPAKIVSEAREPLGARRVSSFELRGKDNGKLVRALEMVDSTQYRTYAVTVVTGAKPSRERLREARAIIGTVSFSKPVATPAKNKR